MEQGQGFDVDAQAVARQKALAQRQAHLQGPKHGGEGAKTGGSALFQLVFGKLDRGEGGLLRMGLHVVMHAPRLTCEGALPGTGFLLRTWIS